ncbi:hypothetical protein BD779DRAFT_1456019 [Infundibulicybe gibba]|nr:hypothetical protein BD779DRAFT_1456019 [Infundibulicybe gibba]
MTRPGCAPSRSAGNARQPSRVANRAPSNIRANAARRAVTRATSPAGSAEEFDLVSSGSEDSDDERYVIQPTSSGTNQPAPQAPDASTPDSSRSSTTAHDIEFFFIRGDKNDPQAKTVCKVCSYEAHPGSELLNYKYATTTSNSPLRVHLENSHSDAYIAACKENGWKMMLPKLRKTQERLRAPQTGLARPEFSTDEFLIRLVNFVVANDQASFCTYYQGLKANLAVGHWTMDNAENNNTLMQHLAVGITTPELPFGAKENRIMCFPHIINICTQHMIADFSATTNEEYNDSMEVNDDFLKAPLFPQAQTYEDACARDPIALGRNIVRVIRASGQRREEFRKWIVMCNQQELFRTPEGVPVRVRELELLHDAIDHYLEHGPQNYSLRKYRLTSMEWTVLVDFKDLLCIPHCVQQAMSGEKYPTLSGTIPAFELYMSELEVVVERDNRLQVVRWATISLTWAKKYYRRMDLTSGYIMAMFVNPSVRFEWIAQNWGDEYKNDAELKIKKLAVLDSPPPKSGESTGIPGNPYRESTGILHGI